MFHHISKNGRQKSVGKKKNTLFYTIYSKSFQVIVVPFPATLFKKKKKSLMSNSIDRNPIFSKLLETACLCIFFANTFENCSAKSSRCLWKSTMEYHAISIQQNLIVYTKCFQNTSWQGRNEMACKTWTSVVDWIKLF